MTFDEWFNERKHWLSNKPVCKAIWDAATEAENKACSEICDYYAKQSSNPMNFANNCSDEIQARMK